MITVILNTYKRPHYLQEQIDSIRNQTIKPEDIFIWYNKPEDGEQYDISDLGCKVATCNHNFKFHGRFAFGLLAKTEYVAFFDDDTIPGQHWFKNCMDTIELGYDGILGTSGVRITGNTYSLGGKFGWNGQQVNEVKEVDLVGHAWFMKKDYLRYLWYEEPISWENGEDIQLSYLSQKYGGIKTYVPPHPKNDQSMWGSKKDTGIRYGMDKNAHSIVRSSHIQERTRIVQEQISRGWETVENK